MPDETTVRINEFAFENACFKMFCFSVFLELVRDSARRQSVKSRLTVNATLSSFYHDMVDAK